MLFRAYADKPYSLHKPYSLNSTRRKPANNKNEPVICAAEAFDIRNVKMANASEFILNSYDVVLNMDHALFVCCTGVFNYIISYY